MLKISVLFITCLLSLSICVPLSTANQNTGVAVDIIAVDPNQTSRLGTEDKLYIKVRYESDIPVRFQALGMLDGTTLEVGAIKNPAALYPPGKGEALAWLVYTNLTHIDSVRVSVLDQKWGEVVQTVKAVDVAWEGTVAATPREPADWVDSLVKADRRKTDFVYDPSPRKYGFFFDIFFFLNVASLPAYILLQLHMLYHYRYRWRELAMIPIFPYLIVGFYLLVGLEIERSLLITFLFRYTFGAFLWLAALFVAKRYWQNKLPPPKLYKPPKAD